MMKKDVIENGMMKKTGMQTDWDDEELQGDVCAEEGGYRYREQVQRTITRKRQEHHRLEYDGDEEAQTGDIPDGQQRRTRMDQTSFHGQRP